MDCGGDGVEEELLPRTSTWAGTLALLEAERAWRARVYVVVMWGFVLTAGKVLVACDSTGLGCRLFLPILEKRRLCARMCEVRWAAPFARGARRAVLSRSSYAISSPILLSRCLCARVSVRLCLVCVCVHVCVSVDPCVSSAVFSFVVSV